MFTPAVTRPRPCHSKTVPLWHGRDREFTGRLQVETPRRPGFGTIGQRPLFHVIQLAPGNSALLGLGIKEWLVLPESAGNHQAGGRGPQFSGFGIVLLTDIGDSAELTVHSALCTVIDDEFTGI